MLDENEMAQYRGRKTEQSASPPGFHEGESSPVPKRHRIRRKLQKVGRSTLSLTLPKEWVDKVSARPGDEVALEINPDGSITIIPGGMEPLPRSASIEIRECSPPGEWFQDMITAAYRNGIETLEIKFPPELRETVWELLMNACDIVPGMSIVAEGQGKIILQCFTDVSHYSYSRLMWWLSTLIDGLFAPLTGEEAPLKGYEFRMKEVQQAYNLTARQCFQSLTDKNLASSVGITSDADVTSNIMCGNAIQRLSVMLVMMIRLREKEGFPEGIGDVFSELRTITKDAISSNISPGPFEKLGSILDRVSEIERKVDTMFPVGDKDPRYPCLYRGVISVIHSIKVVISTAFLKRARMEMEKRK